MVVPDDQLVAEVILFCEGFDKATWLAREDGHSWHRPQPASMWLSNQVKIWDSLAIFNSSE